MGKEDDIIRHLDLCALLMSDPKIMTKYPDIVVSQFHAAKASIETLGAFLTARSVDPCGCHTRGWMDLSIISNGIGKLVSQTLDTHMGVVRTDGFPEIFKRDFKTVVEGLPDVYYIREIKESNCMGSIVLLYYYLYWYLCLILLNKRLDPMYCTKDQLDIDKLIKSLPKSRAFLEYRSLGKSFRDGFGVVSGKLPEHRQAMAAELVKNNLMYSGIAVANPEKQHDALKRKTWLVSAYRRALDTNLQSKYDDELEMEFPVSFKGMTTYFVFNTITVDTVLHDMLTMGGVSNIIDMQRGIDKWSDMYKDITVAGCVGGERAQYKTSLRKALSSKAYMTSEAGWVLTARRSCIYDYCSASLMMDICRSFQRLSVLVMSLLENKEDGEILKLLLRVTADLSGYSSDKQAIDRILKENGISDFEPMDDESMTFIDKKDSDIHFTDKTFTIRVVPTKDKELRFWFDKFKALYPNRNATNAANRRFFLLCSESSDKNLEGMVSFIQTTLRALKKTRVDSSQNPLFGDVYNHMNALETLSILCPLLRNSAMLIYCSITNLSLLDSLMKTPYFRDISCNMNDSIYPAKFIEIGNGMGSAISNQSAQMGIDDELRNLIGHVWAPKQAQFNTNLKNRVTFGATTFLYSQEKFDKQFTFTDVIGMTRSNMQFFESLVQTSKTFKSYPALAWPVHYTVHGGVEMNNKEAFKKVKDTKPKQGTPYVDLEIARTLAASAEKSMVVSDELLKRLAQLPPGGGQPPLQNASDV